MILTNSAKCLKCGDDIYSVSIHDFRRCSCGNVFVDGGMEYLRHGYIEKDNYKDASIVISEELYNACIKELEWCDSTGRNNLGRLCAIFRVLRDNDVLK